MIDTRTPLIAEFLKDHQQFSRLLFEIKKLLDEGKIDKAQERAFELDELAGPHIAYEESELYPRLEQLTNKEVSEKLLVGQHHEVLEAVRRLTAEESLTADQIEEIKAGFELGLSHAEHCGSLISLMSQLDEEEQSQSLSELKRFRGERKKWTDLA